MKEETKEKIQKVMGKEETEEKEVEVEEERKQS